MDQILDAPVEDKRTLEYAGFWIRALALMIDGVILFGALILVSIAMGGEIESDSALLIIVIYGFFFLYFIVLESSEKQATLGKMVVGIKVGDKNGKRISFGRAMGRSFAKILSGMILYVGYMMAGWDKQKQALHDNIAETFVFYSR